MGAPMAAIARGAQREPHSEMGSSKGAQRFVVENSNLKKEGKERQNSGRPRHKSNQVEIVELNVGNVADIIRTALGTLSQTPFMKGYETYKRSLHSNESFIEGQKQLRLAWR
ncbi:hypothetical protein CRG98_047195 [Punica granatum]|uniref:Uncharacterized protein n=1 Tax=Punica granatum TaxID=22663 RepID=A0A2I0HL29_PUNGR|nr:hypothetical protein CRG98_047195 [Punica granatum]